MSTPSPLVPKGSIQDLPKGRRNLPVLVFSVIGFHVAALGVALMIGCKPETSKTVDPVTDFSPTNSASSLITDTPTTNPYEMPAQPTAAPGTPLASASTNVPPIGSMPAPGFAPDAGAPMVPAVPTPSTGGFASPGKYGDPLPPANEPASSAMTEHKVKSGESFSVMAVKYGVSTKAIVDANPNLDPKRLKVGQVVLIPAPTRSAMAPAASPARSGGSSATSTGSYAVKPGDNLTKIAKDHGISVKALKSLNGLKTDRINVGQKLKVPVKSAPIVEPAPEPIPAPVITPVNSSFGTVPPTTGSTPAVPVPASGRL